MPCGTLSVSSEELVVSRPGGTSLVYLSNPLVYSYLVNLSTKKVKSKGAVQNTYALLIQLTLKTLKNQKLKTLNTLKN